MTRRINVVQPVEAIELVNRVAVKGSLARRLKAGALANAKRDLEIAREWFPVDEEAWRRTKSVPTRKGKSAKVSRGSPPQTRRG